MIDEHSAKRCPGENGTKSMTKGKSKLDFVVNKEKAKVCSSGMIFCALGS